MLSFYFFPSDLQSFGDELNRSSKMALPEDLGLKDLCSLLAMSDLYLMAGLKDAVAPLLGKHLKVKNILQISTMAEKHTAVKLQEQCSSFILDNIDEITPQCLDKLADLEAEVWS